MGTGMGMGMGMVLSNLHINIEFNESVLGVVFSDVKVPVAAHLPKQG